MIKNFEKFNFKIMVVSRNVNLNNNLGTKLRLEGYIVELTDSGFQLLHLLELHRDYHLIIIYDHMADMSADEMIMLIRNNNSKTELPIIYISKKSNEEEIIEMVLKGANEYVVKSDNLAAIHERILKYFNLKKNS